ncbi:MAG TPA: DNA methyltransferase [Ktedonobacteraceae bacterium]|nr:DNA methyltransferase [Ktedonobacteraceae bacterium]
MTTITPHAGAFTIASFRLDKTGLVPLGTPTLENWVSCGRFIKDAEKSVQFWVGDWLIYGETHFGKTDYEKAIEETGLSYQTLRIYKHVASVVPLSLRRNKLSFHHHKEVASLSQETQETLLNQAEKHNWPVLKLKQEKYRYQLEQARGVSLLSSSLTSRILSGESTTVLAGLPTESIDLVVSAPRFAALTSDVLQETFSQLARCLKINSHLYLFLNRFEYAWLLPLIKPYFTVKNLLIWETAPGLPSSAFRYTPAYDFILFAHKGRRHLNGRRDASVFRWTAGLPTAPGGKPLPLLEYLIEKSSLPGEMVCDPFASPATPVGVAARNKGRQYIGVPQEETKTK